MKTGIHPEYVDATVTCSCGETFTTRATQPEIRVELCSRCHPFYTGKQKLVDSGGRVERYKQRFAKSEALKQRGPAPEAAAKPAAPAKAKPKAAATKAAAAPKPKPKKAAGKASKAGAAAAADSGAAEPEPEQAAGAEQPSAAAETEGA